MKPPAATPACNYWIGGNRNWTYCYRGTATHPVFVALQSTIDEFEIPSEPFRDLLVAFRQDQYRNRYETFNELARILPQFGQSGGAIGAVFGALP